MLLNENLIRHRNLIHHAQEGNYQAASYDLRLGDEYRDNHGSILRLQIGERLVIPPAGVVIVSTWETIVTDTTVIGRFDLKVRFALRGLILQVGTQVEPNYKGRLFGLLFNLSSKEVGLYRRTDLFTIEFHELADIRVDPEADPPTKAAIDTIEQFLKEVDVDEPVSPLLVTMQKNYANLERLEGKMSDRFAEQNQAVESLRKELHDEISNTSQRTRSEVLSEVSTRHLWILGILASLFIVGMSIMLPVVLNNMVFDADSLILHALESQTKDQRIEKELEHLRAEIEELRNGDVESVSRKPAQAPAVGSATANEEPEE